MAKFDLENMVDEVVALVKAQLNTKIAEINAEKADSVTLATIEATAYSVLSLNNGIMNFDPFVVVYVEDIESQGIGPGTADFITLPVIVVAADMGTDTEIYKRMLRYMRALKEIFEENFQRIEPGNNLIIESVAPQYITGLNTNKRHRGAGVALKFTMC